jgi:hypothetical protein
MTMATTQAATKLRMGILQFVDCLNELNETHMRMVARNSQGPRSENLDNIAPQHSDPWSLRRHFGGRSGGGVSFKFD